MPTIERAVPQNIEAEQAVLGSILIDDNALFKVASFLRPEHFYVEKNGWVFAAFLRVSERREPIDVLTVCDELERQERLQEAGGPAYITSLLNAVPTAIHVEYYGRLVERAAVLRELIAAAGEIARLSYEATDEADDALDQAEQLIFNIAQGRVGGDFVPLSQILAAYLEQLDQVKEGATTLGLPTGFVDLDKLTGGLQPGDLIILAARPSVGKTALALNIAHHVAVKEHAPVAVFSLEMSREQLAHRLLCVEARIDSQRLRLGQYDEDELRRVSKAFAVLSEAPVYVDDTAGISAIELRSKARRLHLERGIRLVVVDYLQLMRGRRAENRVQEISDISRSLKGLAKELGVPVLALSQLSRAPEQRTDHRPVLSDLRESGCLAGDTLVQLSDGRRVPIAHLAQDGQPAQVQTLDETTWKLESATIRRAWYTGVKPVFRLRTQLGREIKASANHRFLTATGWKRLDQLTPGQDRVALPRSWEMLSPDQSTLSEAEVALLAHLVGDGCTLPRHTIQYTTNNRELADLVGNLGQQIFGAAVTPRVERQRQWWQVFLSASEQLTHGVRNPVAAWLDDLGVWGLRSYEKHVPAVLFEQPPSLISRFLRHLWATDGTLGVFGQKKRRALVLYASSSSQLALDVQHLLLRLGIIARVRRVPQGTRGRDQWHVLITGRPDVMAFVERVGVLDSQQARLDTIRAYYQSRAHNPNQDVIPATFWHLLVEPARQSIGLSQRALHAALGTSYCGSTLYKSNLSRDRATRVGRIVESEPLLLLGQSDVYWDKVAAIESDGEAPVYDLEVPGYHNFVAGDILVHNSIEQDADLVVFIYREELYDPETEKQGIADILVAKHRNGPIGNFGLYFFKETTRFANLAAQAEPQ